MQLAGSKNLAPERIACRLDRECRLQKAPLGPQHGGAPEAAQGFAV
jgi:hypothetical protein